jgi:glycosyltransferase involved in cell wall biosynthesis
MKVLWFTNTPSLASKITGKLSYGGGWIESLQEHLVGSTRISLAIAYYSNDSKEAKFLHEGVHYYPIMKNRFSIYERYLNIEQDRNLISKYLKIVNDFKPDVIHIFGTENGFAGIITQTKIPILIHLQGLTWPIMQNWLPLNFTMNQVLFNSSLIKLLRGSGVYKSYFTIKRQAVREIMNCRKINFFSGRTEWDKSYVRLLKPEAKYFHVDEIMREAFYNDCWTFPKNRKIKLLTVISPNIFKGLDTVFKAALELKEKEEVDFEWNLVGLQKDDELVKIVEHVLKIKNHSLGINFLGYKMPAEIISLMKSSNLFIHPSHIDNSPNSVCEAMLVGIPVVAANVGGLNTLIDDNENGLLYRDYNISELCQIICEGVNSESKLTSISNNARKKALIRHDRVKIVENTVEIYSQLTNNTF